MMGWMNGAIKAMTNMVSRSVMVSRRDSRPGILEIIFEMVRTTLSLSSCQFRLRYVRLATHRKTRMG